jgi:hypothetical protein
MTTNGTHNARLPRPYHFRHLTPGEPAVFVVTRIETGMVLRPVKPDEREIELLALRMWLAQNADAGDPPYLDWTHHSIVDVIPVMFNFAPSPARIRLTRKGTGQQTRYTIERLQNGE